MLFITSLLEIFFQNKNKKSKLFFSSLFWVFFICLLFCFSLWVFLVFCFVCWYFLSLGFVCFLCSVVLNTKTKNIWLQYLFWNRFYWLEMFMMYFHNHNDEVLYGFVFQFAYVWVVNSFLCVTNFPLNQFPAKILFLFLII